MEISGCGRFAADQIIIDVCAVVTALVGPNAAGKTALLHALGKLFGVSRAQRSIVRSDFHASPNEAPDSRTAKDLYIDVLVALPELRDGTAKPESVAPSFRHMLI